MFWLKSPLVLRNTLKRNVGTFVKPSPRRFYSNQILRFNRVPSLNFKSNFCTTSTQPPVYDSRLSENLAVGLVLSGMDLIDKGNYEKAIENFDRAIDHNPGDNMAWIFRGMAYEKSKKPTEALENFEKAIELFPEDSAGHFYRATVLRSLGRYPEALESIETVLRLEPEEAESMAEKVAILYHLGKYEEGLDVYNKSKGVLADNKIAQEHVKLINDKLNK